ncbi:MAG: flagellar biosynthesis regulator FlaF [Hyphomicrobiales bacterium]|nr:flagellar biosynthesis regulator FlaF [Hyphomicrobiales bacterium]
MQHKAAQAYGRTAQNTTNPRDLEANLLIKAATRLQSVKENWNDRGSDLDDALFYNRQLWTIFVTSATRTENPLPNQIKQNIANLGIFIFNQTLSMIRDPRPEKLNTLITINREIAAGLRDSP